MRKSTSCSSLSSSSSSFPASVPVRPPVVLQAQAHAQHVTITTLEATTEAVAEAFARTPLPSIGLCTELYGFPNEVLEKSIAPQYINCLMEPIEVVVEDIKILESDEKSTINVERMSKWFLIERRRRRRWSTGTV